MLDSLEKFKYTTPYASEAFGLYQPILGWRSKQAIKRVLGGLNKQEDALFRLVSRSIYPDYDSKFSWIKTGTPTPGKPGLRQLRVRYNPVISSYIVDAVLPPGFPNFSAWTEEEWKILAKDNLDKILSNATFIQTLKMENPREADQVAVFRRESIVAGVLNQLYEQKLFTQLISLLTPPPPAIDLQAYLTLRQFVDPLENFDPKTDLGKVGLSPVGLVHLFRQYFFEFDTFLGPSVQHLWLSPGGTVELVEISTRKTTVERTVEQAQESILKSEKSSMDQDDLSDAVKQDNERNIKLGASVTANERWGWGDAQETASVEVSNTEKEAREETHKHMRQQSAKMSSEIKTNFKSTFRTVTETTDVTSKRYVLQNTTTKLVNYELRRKMRRVGVQVQDVGTRLCWQTYVDDPGKQLGVAKLVHFAAPPDVSSLGPVNELPLPDEYSENLTGSFNLPPGEHSYDGWNNWMKDVELMPKDGFECYSVGDLRFTSGGSVDVEVQINRTKQDTGKVYPPEAPQGCVGEEKFPPIYCLTLYLKGGHSDHGGDLMQFTIPVKYRPTKLKIQDIQNAIKTAKEANNVEKNAATRTAYLTAARERIKLAANIQPRPYNDLREEERIVVYRKLLESLMDVGVDLTFDTKVLHKVSELLTAMFDIDKMLYFVAPEWWRPRMHPAQQSLAPELSNDQPGSAPPKEFRAVQLNFQIRRKPQPLDDHIIGWGGTDDSGRDNYYITEESAPARLGSSLGWMMQLDGDNLRNAFLNAPWVKAVIPIVPGKELDALNWLRHAAIEDKNGLCEYYVPSSANEADLVLQSLQAYPWHDNDMDDVCSQDAPQRLRDRYSKRGIQPDGLRVIDALRYLAIKVKEKHIQGQTKISETLPDGVSVNYLPADKVYQFGFDPLGTGFTSESTKPYEVFDEWVEVLPTDQIAAVEVEYDPKTGQLL